MNILFVTEDHSITNYGITSVVSQLADQLAILNSTINLTILATGNEAVRQIPKVKIELVPPASFGHFWGWSPTLSKKIKHIINKENIELIHIHGLWMAAQWYAMKIAKELNIPCIISAHGMLNDWMWQNQSCGQKIKKKCYLDFIFKSVLTHNIIFHAITPAEKEDINFHFTNNPKVIIPNAIETNEENVNLEIPEKKFLFLGRLAPVKAIDILIDAFNKANLGNEWKLLIVGPEYVPDYVERLKSKVHEYGIEDKVAFIGPIYGEQKLEILQKTWAMVIPSYAEVVGMVNLEAAVQNIPSITTYETGLWDWEKGGGLLIHPKIDDLAQALKLSAAWSLDERLDRGNRSNKFVVNNYSWSSVLPKWIKLYSSSIETAKNEKGNRRK